MTPTWEDGTEPLVGGGLVQAGKVDRQVRAALAAAKEVQTGPSQNERLMRYADETREEFYKGIKEAIDPTPDIPKIGCVGHDCAECRAREAQPANKVTLTAPSEIWLQVSDDASDCNESFPSVPNDGITWCHESVLGCEVKYVRVDLAQPQPTDGLQNIAAYIGVGGLNGATPEQLGRRIKVEIDRLTAQTLELQAKCADYEAALKAILQALADHDDEGLTERSEKIIAAREVLAKHGRTA